MLSLNYGFWNGSNKSPIYCTHMFESNFSLPFFFLFLFCFVVVFFLIFATSTGLHTSNTYFTSEIYYAETQAVTYYSFSLTSLNIFQ